MIARRCHFFLLLPAVLATALRAAPVTPPAGIDPQEPVQAAPPSAAINATDGSTATPAATNAPPPATETHEALKPGILSAAKAKGPPPIAKTPAAPVPLSPRFQQIRDRVDALFHTRNAPPAPPDPLANPFRAPGAGPALPLPAADGATPEPIVVNDDLARLQQAVATLRVRGTVQRGKLLQLVITSAPGKEGTYKEGDIINVVLPPGDPVHVRVRQISRNSVTLTVNDAEMVLRF